VTVADTVTDEVALWHDTDAGVIAHITPVVPTAKVRLDEAAAAAAGTKAAASMAVMRPCRSRRCPMVTRDAWRRCC
jgi:hypothetical protein